MNKNATHEHLAAAIGGARRQLGGSLSRLLTAVAVVGVHAAVLLVAIQAAPRVVRTASRTAQVVFISESRSTQAERARPLDIVPVFTLQPIALPQPDLQAELAVSEAASNNAITLPAQPAAPATAPASAPKLVSTVEYVHEPAPRYPPLSRREREQGTVILKVLIDAAGRAAEITVQQSSGYARLDEAAREAVLQAEFRPYSEDGSAQAVYVFVPIEFALSGMG